MKNIGIVGAGIMGAGIAQVAAECGYSVKIYDLASNMLEKAVKNMQKSWQKALEKEKITQEEMDNRVGLVQPVNDMSAFADVDLVIEAIAENLDAKMAVFSKLDEICAEKTILASNTSTLPITQIASFTKRPDKVVGMHFFNPVPVMKLVEVIQGNTTSDETAAAIKDLSTKLGKVPVIAKDVPGFIVNRILIPLCNEAVCVLQEGVASAEDIDTAMKLGCNWPMGPLALTDMAGLDICLAGMETYSREFGDQKYRPSYLLRQKVRSNELGAKTGKGFYDYSK